MNRKTSAVAATLPAKGPSRVVLRPRYSAWLNGDLGQAIEGHLKRVLMDVPGLRLNRLPSGLVVEANEAPGVLVEHAIRAAAAVEAEIAKAYPIFVHEMGSVWTGTYMVLPPEVQA